MRIAGLLILVFVAASGVGLTRGAEAASLRLVIFSDFNGPYGSTTYSPLVMRTVGRITEEWRPDLVLSAGDLVAGQKLDLPETRFAEMWAAFDRTVARPLREAGIPFGFALGNHDASAARDPRGGYRFQRERDAAAAYWRDPAHRPRLDYRDASHFPFYYSFMIGGVFIVALDATSHIVQDARWVQAVLGSRDARDARLRIVIGHLPLYGVSVGRSRFGEVIEDGDLWRRRFEGAGVDLYISGHHAAYYPAHRGRLRLLHSGGIGSRAYVGYPQIPSRSTVTLMQVDLRTRAIALETFDAETGARIPLGALPPCLDGYNGPVFRIDVAQTERCAPPR